MRVFVSHSSRNLDVALAVEEELRGLGHDPWLDATDIRAGELLRAELHQAMAHCEAVVVLWSEPASRSRWCAAEILAAHHLARGIVVGDVDGTARPLVLSKQPTVSLAMEGPAGVAVSAGTVASGRYEPPLCPRALEPNVQELHDQIGAAQLDVLALANTDLSGARRQHAELTERIVRLADQFSGEPVFWTLLGYQLKNTYQLVWWDQQGALRPPADPLLLKAERWFFQALFADPDDLEALNGLGSVLITEREAEAARFFIDRVLAIAAAQHQSYPAAAYDRLLAESLQQDRTGLLRRLQPQRRSRRRVHPAALLASKDDLAAEALSSAVEVLAAEDIDLLPVDSATSMLGAVPAACSLSRAAVTVWSGSALDDADQLTRLLVAIHEGCRIVPVRLDTTPVPDLLAGVLSVDLGSDRPEELDKLVRTLLRPPRARQILMAARDWEPPELRRIGARTAAPSAAANEETRARLVRQAGAAAARWPGYPGAERYLAQAHLVAAGSTTTSRRGLTTRRRHLEKARLAALRALLLDPTDAPSLALLSELSTLLELPLTDYFKLAARHHAEQRGEEVS